MTVDQSDGVPLTLRQRMLNSLYTLISMHYLDIKIFADAIETVMRKRRKELPFATTLEVRDSCYALHLQRAARVAARLYDESLRPLGLTNQQFALLMSLNRPESPTIAAVAALLGMDPTTLTANLKPLARRGLLEVLPDPADRRQRRLKLTDPGKALLVDGLPLWRALQRRIEQTIPAGHRDRLLGDLLALSGVASTRKARQ